MKLSSIFNISSILIIFHLGNPNYGQVLDSRYHTVDEIYAYLDSLDQLEELDGWYRVDTIGYSTHDQIPILAVKISDNVDVREDEPSVLFVGQVHAEEILGNEIVLDLIDDLLFPDNSIFTHMNILKQYLEIWIIPTANPDGLNVVHEGLDVSYRKTKRDLSPEGPYPNELFDYDPSIGNDIDGVDLNRNFNFNWVFGDTFLEPDNSDYASHYDYYKGEEPFSEGEAIAIRDLALENDFVFSIVWHSSRSGNLSEKVFTSWRWEETKDSPDLNVMKSIADHFAGLIETEDGTGTYLSVYSGSRNGKLHDWFYRETGCIQYLVECGTENLQPGSTLIEDTIERNKPAMVYLMDRALGYYTDAAQVTGIISDATSNQPIENAIVEILEHTGSVLKPRLTNEFGRYRRILDAGTYTLSIRAKGYIPKEVTVVTNNSGITNEDIYLEPAPLRSLILNLYHETTDNNTITGFIENEFGKDEIQISTGPNNFSLYEGNYILSFKMDGEMMPWHNNITITSNMEMTVPYWYGNPQSLSDSWIWTNSEGPWCTENLILKSQEEFYYENGDSSQTLQWMESDLIDVTGTNRLVVTIDHRFETEWDYDHVSLSILDEGSNVLANKSWTGNQWEEFHTDLISATSLNEFSNIKVRLSFLPDQTVNYRGWEIQSLTLFSTMDDFLGITETNINKAPKNPMRISGLYPNPSNGSFQIDLTNFPGGEATVKAYNLLGQEIYFQKFQRLSPGRHFINFNLSSMSGVPNSSGMVFIRIDSQNSQVVKKCLILKN
ncbi:MAG: hypothetical protein CMG57_05460 [Candidatus Marinimicrobia bacterium]|nr:hypothetical protein [Candidatus Neomarinimicrobiota bacterium]